MAEFPSLPLFTDAYIADTQHLTNEEHGVYLRLIMFAWRSPNCALPNDEKRIAIMVGMTPKKWASVREQVMAFWTLTDDGWQQSRLVHERRRVAENAEKAAAAGRASARAKRERLTPKSFPAGSNSSRDNANRREAYQKAKPLENHEVTSTDVPTELPLQSNPPSPSPVREKEEPNGSSKKRPSRGSRLPEDWRAPEDWIAWAVSTEKMSESVARREADKFRDFWRAKAGKEGTKLDWLATWRNWIRNSADFASPRQSSAFGKPKVGDKREHPQTGATQEYAGGLEGWMTVHQ